MKQQIENMGLEDGMSKKYYETQQRKQAEADVEIQKGLRAAEKMRPAVENALLRAEQSLDDGSGIGAIGGRLVGFGLKWWKIW